MSSHSERRIERNKEILYFSSLLVLLFRCGFIFFKISVSELTHDPKTVVFYYPTLTYRTAVAVTNSATGIMEGFFVPKNWWWIKRAIIIIVASCYTGGLMI